MLESKWVQLQAELGALKLKQQAAKPLSARIQMARREVQRLMAASSRQAEAVEKHREALKAAQLPLDERQDGTPSSARSSWRHSSTSLPLLWQ